MSKELEIVEKVAWVAHEAAADLNWYQAVEIGNSLAKELSLAGVYAKAASDAGVFKGDDIVIPGSPNIKGTYGDYLGRLAQLWSGDIMGVKNRPGPLSSMLVMAPLGAGLGLAGGYLGNKLTGGHVFTSNLRNALIGAGIAALPGVAYAGLNYAAGKPVLTGTVLDTPENKVTWTKRAFMTPPVTGSYISVDGLKDFIYTHPGVAPFVPPVLQAATVGLVEGAQNLPGRTTNLPIVTPHDIGRMAVGLGSGYASGVIAGEVLSGLLGLSDQAKNQLARSGAAVGFLKSVIPMAYGM